MECDGTWNEPLIKAQPVDEINGNGFFVEQTGLHDDPCANFSINAAEFERLKEDINNIKYDILEIKNSIAVLTEAFVGRTRRVERTQKVHESKPLEKRTPQIRAKKVQKSEPREEEEEFRDVLADQSSMDEETNPLEQNTTKLTGLTFFPLKNIRQLEAAEKLAQTYPLDKLINYIKRTIGRDRLEDCIGRLLETDFCMKFNWDGVRGYEGLKNYSLFSTILYEALKTDDLTYAKFSESMRRALKIFKMRCYRHTYNVKNNRLSKRTTRLPKMGSDTDDSDYSAPAQTSAKVEVIEKEEDQEQEQENEQENEDTEQEQDEKSMETGNFLTIFPIKSLQKLEQAEQLASKYPKDKLYEYIRLKTAGIPIKTIIGHLLKTDFLMTTNWDGLRNYIAIKNYALFSTHLYEAIRTESLSYTEFEQEMREGFRIFKTRFYRNKYNIKMGRGKKSKF